MLNNKGFAVSAVLYTLLVAFLLFLAVVLSTFSYSSDLVRRANTDLINNYKFKAEQVTLTSGWNNKALTNCVKTTGIKNSNNFYWYESPVIVRIESQYGTYYWPKDFKIENSSGSAIDAYNNAIITYNAGQYTYLGNGEANSNDNKIKTKVVNVSGKLLLNYKHANDDSYNNSLELIDTCS